jgi:hypothetical protein
VDIPHRLPPETLTAIIARKQFFFEKKNQKTLVIIAYVVGWASAHQLQQQHPPRHAADARRLIA